VGGGGFLRLKEMVFKQYSVTVTGMWLGNLRFFPWCLLRCPVLADYMSNSVC
jgi:hypothetical protein